MQLAVDLHENFIDVEGITVASVFSLQSARIKGSELDAPETGEQRLATHLAKSISRSGDGYLHIIIPLALALLGIEESIRTIQMLAGALMVERALYWSLKNSLRRPRPHDFKPGVRSLIEASDKFSFPSGHSSGAFLLATGQGHISRARAMAKAFKEYDVEVTWLFSGRSRGRLFDMEPFGDWQHRRGLSYVTRAGKIDSLATLASNNFFTFLRDLKKLDLSGYDLVVTDYEPLTAWASRMAGKKCIGIGHQYSFGENTPTVGCKWWTKAIMRNFAPVDIPVGLHWAAYDENVLPPILDLPDIEKSEEGHILVYLPAENQAAVTRWLNSEKSSPDIAYPNVARSLSRWLASGCGEKTGQLGQQLWQG